MGVTECKDFAFGTSTPLPHVPTSITPFGNKMLSFLNDAIPDFLLSGKRPACEEAKPFVMVLPLSNPDLLPLATTKRLTSSAGISQLGEGFPLISDGSLRAELEKRSAFFHSLSNLTLIDTLIRRVTAVSITLYSEPWLRLSARVSRTPSFPSLLLSLSKVLGRRS